MQLEDKYLKKLKCSACSNYLSCFPVMINNGGDSICGKCHCKNPTNTIRNKVYEKIAKGILFPCVNKGCIKRFLVEELEKHEQTCDFREFSCPIYEHNGCDWKGCSEKSLNHCLEKHPELIVNQPYEEHLDITNKEVSSHLTYIFGYIFLLQIKCSMLHDKILHKVQLFGDSALCCLFKYDFELESFEGGMKKKFILDQTWQETKISNLVNILGNLNNITMRLTLKMAEENCAKCNTKLVHPIHKEGKFYCKDCTTIDNIVGSMFCSNKTNGCAYQCDANSNLLKHERWFCEYSSLKCKWGCGSKLTDVNRFQHYISNYLPSDIYLGYNNEIGETYHAVVIVHDVQFLCKWTLRTSDSAFSIYIVTNQPADQSQNYYCSIEVTDSKFVDNMDNNFFGKVARNSIWKDKTSNWDYSVECHCKDIQNYNLLLKIEKVCET